MKLMRMVSHYHYYLMMLTFSIYSHFALSINSFLEGYRYSGPENEVFDNGSRCVGDVEEDLNHVALLAIVALVLISVHNQV